MTTPHVTDDMQAPATKPTFVKYTDFKASNLVIGKPERQRGGKGNPSVSIRYNNDGRVGPLTTTTPVMSQPFGIGDNMTFAKPIKDPKTGLVTGYETPIKQHVNLSFGNDPQREDIGAFRKMIQETERIVLEVAFRDRKIWFADTDWSDDPKDRQVDERILRSKFVSAIKSGKAKEGSGKSDYPDTIKLNIRAPYPGGGGGTGVFDESGAPITSYGKGHFKGWTGAGIIQAMSIYFVMGKFGVTWSVNQLKVFRREDWNSACHVPDDFGTPETPEAGPPTKRRKLDDEATTLSNAVASQA